ncbi:MAG TPA: FAD-dependent oxidoreductase [Streptosporangiales bacterium]
MTEITVVGGGLGGLVAAITAAEAGARVTLHEAHSGLGGRARTLDGPYRANDGTRVFYGDGPHWAWLAARGLAGPAAKVGRRELTRLVFRHAGRVRGRPPAALLRAVAHRRLRAPFDRDFHGWACERFGERAARAVEGFAGIITFDADPGRLSAEFVWERVLRVAAPKPPAARYVIGGWQSVVDRLAGHARRLGVRIETGSRVTELPPPPVVVATHLASARSLVGDDGLDWESGRSVLLALGLAADPHDPFIAWDLDEGGFSERYTGPDPSLAPPGHSLVQAQLPMRPGERTADAVARLERLFDQSYRDWRGRVVWRRDAVANGRTGAVDLPGRTWRDRPAVARGNGVYVAGDQVAAPGFLSEVTFASAIEAATRAVRDVTRSAGRSGRPVSQARP